MEDLLERFAKYRRECDKTIKEMCEAQISNGIRIWKARPDFSKYTASNR